MNGKVRKGNGDARHKQRTQASIHTLLRSARPLYCHLHSRPHPAWAQGTEIKNEMSNSYPWVSGAMIGEITKVVPCTVVQSMPTLRKVQGVESWVELIYRHVHGKLDPRKVVTVLTQSGKEFTASIEGVAHVHPKPEFVQQIIDKTFITVSGVPLTGVQAGDLLVQSPDAPVRPPRVFTSDMADPTE